MDPIGSKNSPLIVGVIGSGPSGFYAAEALLKSDLAVKVHLIEKLPAPYGLVRYGVAPDHPKLKQVSLLYHKIAQHPDLTYFGNVEIGNSVSVEDLQNTHHAIIFCTGADSDRRLGIQGEDISGSHTATEFVAWYNGHPDYCNYSFDLSQETAVIIGQGNVAADVCRILAKPIDELSKTDICKHALYQLSESKVRNIHLIGRRGPAQAKFASKELRELGELTDCSTSICKQGYSFDAEDMEELADKSDENAAKCKAIFDQFEFNTDPRTKKNVVFHFLLSPREIIGNGSIQKLVLERNKLQGPAFSRVPKSTGEILEMDCGLCFRSIGYRGLPLAGVFFDSDHGVIPNIKGRAQKGKCLAIRQYVSGWIKRGPSGIIGTNRADSVETIATLLNDFKSWNDLKEIPDNQFSTLLIGKKINSISYEQWLKIDSREIELGQISDKPREKLVSISQMLAIVT